MKERRRQWTAEEAAQVLGEWRASRQPLSRFAAARGIRVGRLHFWLSRLGRQTAGTLVPVVVPRSAPRLEVHLGAAVVFVDRQTDLELLVDVARALGRLC